MSDSNASVEWWDSATVNRESIIFAQQFGDLQGKTDAQLRETLGEPDVLIQGGHRRMNNDTVTLVADSVQYYSLLPRTTVGLAVYEGVVHDIYFMPKVKKCSPEQVAAFGKTFAPD